MSFDKNILTYELSLSFDKNILCVRNTEWTLNNQNKQWTVNSLNNFLYHNLSSVLLLTDYKFHLLFQLKCFAKEGSNALFAIYKLHKILINFFYAPKEAFSQGLTVMLAWLPGASKRSGQAIFQATCLTGQANFLEIILIKKRPF